MRALFILVILSNVIYCENVEHDNYYGYWLDVVATAYSPEDPLDSVYHASKGDKWRWITADGRTNVKRTPYGIAVPLARKNGKKLNKPWLPFGTEIIIPLGYGYLERIRKNERVFKIDDVGDGKQYYPTKNGKLHIDLRFVGHNDAIKWAGPLGYRELKVFVITGVKPQIVEEVLSREEILGPIIYDEIPEVVENIVNIEIAKHETVETMLTVGNRRSEFIMLSVFIPIYSVLVIFIMRFINKHKKVIVFKFRVVILWTRKSRCTLKSILRKCVNPSLEGNWI